MSNIAYDAGKYTNFSGKIDYYTTKCEVKNATFELLEKEKKYKNKITIRMEFHKGTVVNGNVGGALIKQMDFRGDNIYSSVFQDGVFNGSNFEGSYWLGGHWKGLFFDDSYDKFSRMRNTPPTEWNDKGVTSGIVNKPGFYTNFTGTIKWNTSDITVENATFEISVHRKEIYFHDGVVSSGIANNIRFFYCNFKGGTANECFFEDGTWDGDVFWGGDFGGGVWEGGLFKNSVWARGTWRDGIFNGGTWYDGTWLDGDWMLGTWHGGYDKNGNHHKYKDSPNLWSL